MLKFHCVVLFSILEVLHLPTKPQQTGFPGCIFQSTKSGDIMSLALKNFGKKLDLRRLKTKRCIFLSYFITELSPSGGSSLVRSYC